MSGWGSCTWYSVCHPVTATGSLPHAPPTLLDHQEASKDCLHGNSLGPDTETTQFSKTWPWQRHLREQSLYQVDTSWDLQFHRHASVVKSDVRAGRGETRAPRVAPSLSWSRDGMVPAINGALWPPWKEGNTLSQECNPRTLKTASVCRDETPNTLGVLGFFFFF